MKIKYKSDVLLIKVVLYFTILLNYHFLYLFDYPKLLKTIFITYLDCFIAFEGIVLWLICVNNYRNTYTRMCGWLRKYMVYIFLMCIAVFCYSVIVYNQQSINQTFRIGCRFLYPLLSIPILVIICREKGINNLFKFLNIISACWYVLMILQKIVFNSSGALIFNMSDIFSTDNIATRNSGIRLSLQAFGNIVLLYNFSNIYSGKVKGKKVIFPIIQCALGLYCVIFIQQTRMQILIDFLCIALVVLFNGKTKSKQIIKAIAIVAGGIFIYICPAVSNFFASFTSSEFQYSASSMARSYAVKYYISVLIQYPIFGLGWAFEGQYFQLLHGSMGYAYSSDVGFLGLLSDIGIFAFGYYIWPLIRIIKKLFQCKFRKVAKYNPFAVVLVAYVFLSSFTLIITDGGRAISYAVILAVFEFWIKNDFKNDIIEGDR